MSSHYRPRRARVAAAAAVASLLAIADAGARPAAAQMPADSARPVALKNPHVARVLGVAFPGLGHAYAGEWGRAVRAYWFSVSGIGGASACAALAPDSEEPEAMYALAGVELAIGVVTWVRSANDAPRAARRANERRAADAAAAAGRRRLALAPVVGVAPSGARYAGIAIPFR